jgi:stage V sporulation protein R
MGYAQETLRNLHRLWGRPVHLETRLDGSGKLLTYDGERSGIEDLTPSEA